MRFRRVHIIRFLKYSKGSCAEVRNMLILSRELGLCSQNDIQKSYSTVVEIMRKKNICIVG